MWRKLGTRGFWVTRELGRSLVDLIFDETRERLFNEARNATNGHAKAMANEGGGTWSKSMTHTKDKNGTLSSRTKSMAHEPGGPPVKSTVGAGVSTSR